MRATLLAALLCAAPAFAGDYIARQGNDSVRLTDKPCPAEVVAKIMEQYRGEFLRLANVMWQGKPYVACWMPFQGAALVLYDDQDIGIIPFDHFEGVM